MEVYIDGVRDRTMRIDPDYLTLPCHLIVGQRTPNSQEPKDSRSFVGRIDELAIYDPALGRGNPEPLPIGHAERSSSNELTNAGLFFLVRMSAGRLARRCRLSRVWR